MSPARLFAVHVWGALAMLVVIALLIVGYTAAEQDLSGQRDKRLQSLELSDELRQSSDDITRMVRTYIVTGDETYKEYTNEIIGIRDGKRPRPVEYNKVYWDLVLRDDERPTPMAEPTPLLERMRDAGFTVQEFEKLVEAKENSDELTHREFTAIELIESVVPTPEPSRTAATKMVHDAAYHEAKANIMRPIRDFEVMVDQRTQSAINSAEKRVYIYRTAILLSALLLGLILWSTRRTLRNALGASVTTLYQVADQLGASRSGHVISVQPTRPESVLGQLTQTQQQLLALEQSSSAAEIAQRDIERRFYDLAEASGDWIWETDTEWKFTFVSENALSQLGFRAENMLGMQVMSLVPPGEKDRVRAELDSITDNGTSFRDLEIPLVSDTGFVHTTLSSGNPMTDTYGEIVGYRGIVRDVTAEREHQEQLRVVATAFETLEPLIITDAQGEIVRINRALTDSLGYTIEQLRGKTVASLLASRHEQSFYQEMWSAATRHRTWQGEVWMQRQNQTSYPGWLSVSAVLNDNQRPTHYVCTCLDLTDRKDAESQVAKLAYFDQLTGLPNRTMFMDRLKQAMLTATKTGVYGALLLIDLDHFKSLNDTRGHAIGDQLLNDVAHRLTRCLKRESFIARLGGDEFMVLLPNVSSLETEARIRAEGAAEKILTTLRQPFQLDSTVHFSTQSIGVAVFLGDDVPLEELMRHVDLAMYHAKSTGRDTFSFFEKSLEQAADRRAQMERDLRSGLSDDSFSLAFQPQVGPDGLVVGLEALLRWDNTDWQHISISEVIDVAEGSGLIIPLGVRIFEMACEQVRSWSKHPTLSRLHVAINVSARQLAERDFVSQVQAILQRTGVPAQQLKIEITESVFIDNSEEVIARLLELKEMGFSISLDDFGTGYSSMRYLQQLPLNELKIDRSFVANILHDSSAEAIARSVVNLGDNLGIQVLAEGVETEAQRNAMIRLGCYAWQGYLLSAPVSASRIGDVVARAAKGHSPESVALPKSRRIDVSSSDRAEENTEE